MGIKFPGESAEYRAARDRLLEREVELRRATEAVAAARRDLPPGGVVPEDYVFQGAAPDGSPTGVRLSELFAPGKDSLLIYSFMFPRDPDDDRPGPAGPAHRLGRAAQRGFVLLAAFRSRYREGDRRHHDGRQAGDGRSAASSWREGAHRSRDDAVESGAARRG